MNQLGLKLKLVIIDLPYDSITSSEFVQVIYSKMMALKIKGFQRDYPYGVLPFDNTDLFSTHKIICEVKRDGSMEPVLSYRSINLKRCLKFGINLPILNIANECENSDYSKAVLKIIDHFNNDSKSLSYDSIWTIDPRFRENKPQTLFFKDVMTAIHVLYHEQMQIPYVLAGGIHRFKLERTYHYWGYENLKWDNKDLPPHIIKHLYQETGSMFFLKQFSSEAKEVANKFKYLWEEKILIDEKSINDWNKKAA